MSPHQVLQDVRTKVLPVDATRIGMISTFQPEGDYLDDITIDLDQTSPDAQHVRAAAQQLQTSDVPVAFPTETVYGLGADATRSAAVRGIYKAKQRPADNPLIVHVASLQQLRALLRPSSTSSNGTGSNGSPDDLHDDPIPPVYKPLIERFWPGPLTILLPNPADSRLAPEVTAGLSTFGARIPRHPLALALIKLADRPVAAPSANASTKPSPTAAEHVAFDLNGRIETILDGGPCDVGVESTVVDGLSSPPLVLRPGGVSLEQLRLCPGWEHTQIGYKDSSERESKPKAPGMKYRHYSPKATVVLFESGSAPPMFKDLLRHAAASGKVGLVRTKTWQLRGAESAPHVIQLRDEGVTQNGVQNGDSHHADIDTGARGFARMLQDVRHRQRTKPSIRRLDVTCEERTVRIADIELGADTTDVARGIFSALRELDREDVDAIFVEGIDENEGDVAAAVMNRLRKAAEVRVGD